MKKLTVLEKVYGVIKPEELQPYFAGLCEGLDVKVWVVDATERGWINLEITGQDEEIAAKLIKKTVGTAPKNIEHLPKPPILKGKMLAIKDEGIVVDIGVMEPEPIDAIIPLKTLRTQIADGKPLTTQEIAKTFTLEQNTPIHILIKGETKNKNLLEAEIAEKQIKIFQNWILFGLERLVVAGSTHHAIKKALKASKHWRDITRIERLGLLEHAILCKLGTEARGLIPELGPYLPTAKLAPFSPQKARELLPPRKVD